ncbi:glycosyltransferase family 2 protein [Marinoscillum sp. MHG1-6]|uniref:glycosyltransferase family 2 protein n=1 Tax=Marinoscillum sp. MHG1-6 TaxID=2959627 RepID=UPI0021586F0F|nr:glycosyltransferase family 2 protein [Marinoscillum sp. MHG1-6]
MSTDLKLIIIGLGTLKRPQMLEETLKSFIQLRIPDGYKARLLVADNDPEKSAEPVVNKVKGQLPIECEYIVEENRGIVFMRNAIIEQAREQNTDLLAFIDDDEEVAPNWLEAMLENKAKFNADVVVGRVARILPEDTPKWIIKGKFFERPSITTGTVRKAASTSNVIFDFKLLCLEMGLKFHPALNLAGSSDTFLFTEATEKGAKIIWVNDDLIKESIPTSRMTVKWLLQRAFRHTNCRTIRARLKHSYPRVLWTEGLYGLLHLALGILSLPVYIFLGKAGIVHTLRFIWKGAGSFAGLGGFVFQEYKKVHGH